MNYDIVIRCFNEANWLEKTHEAINLQKSRPNKIVFVDSGSNDGSIRLAKNSIGILLIMKKSHLTTVNL